MLCCRLLHDVFGIIIVEGKNRSGMKDTKLVTTAERREREDPKVGHYGQLMVGEPDEDCDYQVRKIEPSERKLILLKWVHDHEGEIFRSAVFGKALAVNSRTIRKDMEEMRSRGYVSKEMATDANRGTLGPKYHYLGGLNPDLQEFLPSIRKAHMKSNPLGLRDWLWADYKTVVGMCDDWHTYEDKIESYEELTEKKEAVKAKKDSLQKKIEDKMDYSPEFQKDGYKKMKKPREKPKSGKEKADSDFSDLESLKKFLLSK